MHTAIINLTRLGDLLQTQPLISALTTQGQHPTLINLESFAAAAKLLDQVQHQCNFPDKHLNQALEKHWSQALAMVHQWVTTMNNTSWERVINLTPSLSARLLARCLKTDNFSGFGIDDHGFGVHTSGWAAFLQAAAAERHGHPFNLVDIFQRMAGQAAQDFHLSRPTAEAKIQAQALLQDWRDQPLVAFQLGASQEYRRWPVDYFVRAGRILWQEAQLCPLLLGTTDEAAWAQDFSGQADYPHLNLVGQTDLPVLAALVDQAQLLVTNDTGTMHLAAGLGTPIVAIFLATAQPFDTGAYLEGALSLEPDLPCHPCSFDQQCPHDWACTRHIDPEFVGRLAMAYHQNITLPNHPEVRVWQAYFDDHGFLAQRSLSGHDQEERTLWINLQRQLYRQFLDQSWSVQDNILFKTPSDFTKARYAEVEKYLLLLTLIEEQGRLLTLRPYGTLEQKFLLNCQNLHDLLSSSIYFGVLALMWRHALDHHAQDLNKFLEQCAQFHLLLEKFKSHLALA